MQTLKREHLVHTVAFLDPAGGKKSKDKHKSRSAIAVISSDAANRIFIRHSWAERCATERIYQKIYELNEKYKPQIFGIEGNAQQSLFANSVELDAYKSGIRIPVQCIVQPTTMDKDFRIRTYLQPVVASGRLFFKKGDSEQGHLLQEVLDFPTADSKDRIDSLASAVNLIPEVSLLKHTSDQTDDYLEYLRNSGAPASYIEQQATLRSRDDLQISTISDYLNLVRGRN